MSALGEPTIAVAATPREWGAALHRHIADHGGARLRATVLHPDDALAEEYDVLVVDDATSFLTHRLVAELHRRGRRVLGVYDPTDPHGRAHLDDVGADDVVTRDTTPPQLLQRLAELVPARSEVGPAIDVGLPPPPPEHRGRLVTVVGAGGGVGATEVAATIAAAAGSPQHPVALVDADDRAPMLAQRLGVGLYPNVVAAADAYARGHVDLAGVLQPAAAGRVQVLAGVSEIAGPPGEELSDVVGELAASHRVTVANVAASASAVTAADPLAGVGIAATLLRRADTVVLVADASPTGLARALGWLAAASDRTEISRLHVAFNRSAAEAFRRRQLHLELERVLRPAAVWHLPPDARVSRAAWDGEVVASGPFRRAVAALAAAVAPETVVSAPWWRRRRR